jgi:putative transposase
MLDLSGHRFPSYVIITSLRWYFAYSLSYRDIEELMMERGVVVDHSTINRWVVKFGHQIAAEVKKLRRKIGISWRLDETYIKVSGNWRYLYRAVDKTGNTVDFLLTAKRNLQAAKRFLKKAIGDGPRPLKINIDKSGANEAGIKAYNEEVGASIEIRKCKYLNNIVEQDHRWVRRRTRAALGFKAFHCAHATLAGVEAFRMISKGQLRLEFSQDLTPVEQFQRLAV